MSDDKMAELADVSKPDEMKRALRVLKDSYEELAEYQRLVAQLRYAHYKALVDAGFNHEQALALTAGFKLTY